MMAHLRGRRSRSRTHLRPVPESCLRALPRTDADVDRRETAAAGEQNTVSDVVNATDNTVDV